MSHAAQITNIEVLAIIFVINSFLHVGFVSRANDYKGPSLESPRFSLILIVKNIPVYCRHNILISF